MPNHEQEEFCMCEFAAYLRQTWPCAPVAWERNSQDPPDFWLDRSGVRYGVEVVRALHKDDETLTAGLFRLGKQFEEEVRAEIHGTCEVSFEQSLSNPRTERVRLKGQIADYVRRTAALPNSPREPLCMSGRKIGEIEKLSPDGREIIPSGNAVDLGGWPDDVEAQLRDLLAPRLREKHRMAEAAAGEIILLIHDCYNLATQQQFHRCVSAQLGAFHTAYVVSGPGRGFVIATRFAR